MHRKDRRRGAFGIAKKPNCLFKKKLFSHLILYTEWYNRPCIPIGIPSTVWWVCRSKQGEITMQNTCCQMDWDQSGRWFEDAFLYHIYPLGMLGCERWNDGGAVHHRLRGLEKLTDHWIQLGVDAVYFGPLFESSSHGYDTKDYYHIDRRLGDDADFAHLVDVMHAAGIRVIVDAVFNHVGREFWGFKEVLEKRDMARTRHWFKNLRFDGRRRDGVACSNWEGHDELVKLDLLNPEVEEHLLGAVEWWVSQFHIDGLRLDAADCLEPEFVRHLRGFCDHLKPDFLLVGEVIHGDYRTWANDEMMHGTTNYEAYKGLWSSHNDGNFHEIAYTLNRQFGAGGIYRDLQMYNFADNHDVDRVASKLRSPFSLYSLYAMMFLMPGTPSVYYGSEWGILGRKGRGYDADIPIRPAISVDALTDGHVDQTQEGSALESAISRLAHLRKTHSALRNGSYRQIQVSPQTLVFERANAEETLVCLVSDEPISKTVIIPGLAGRWSDVLNGGDAVDVSNGQLTVDTFPHWARVFKRD